MGIHRMKRTYKLGADRREALTQAIAEAAPEAMADRMIDGEVLRELLGDSLEEEGEGAERFGLFWPGKRAARKAAKLPPRGALAPAPGEAVHEETTRHLYIKGENLEVLKLLRKAYAGRVKVVCIDPPYNTWNDFLFQDDYSKLL